MDHDLPRIPAADRLLLLRRRRAVCRVAGARVAHVAGAARRGGRT